MITRDELATTSAVLARLGAAVLERRAALGVSQRTAAEMIGLSATMITRIERGHIPNGTNLPVVLSWLEQTQWIEVPRCLSKSQYSGVPCAKDLNHFGGHEDVSRKDMWL